MEISTKKHLYKLTINKKACGEVEIAAKCDGVFYRAVERGLKEWEEESQRNS